MPRRLAVLLPCLAFALGAAPTLPAAERPLPSLQELSQAYETLATEVGPSVVQIFAMAYAPDPGSALLTTQRGSGSGVVVDADGYIVTNAHVVSGARRIQVELPEASDGTGSILEPRGRLVGAQVVGLDHETDIAVLKIQEQGLPVLPMGDSEKLRPGQIVLALGSPLGLQNSVTMGVVSAVARQLRPEDRMIYIQTDAPINPGSSGGALVDAQGQLIGINTMIVSQGGGNEGLGFAAPANIVRSVYEQIRTHGRVRRGELGVKAQTVTPLLAAGLALPRHWGVLLADVAPGGPAAHAGLQPGDFVLALDGKLMENGRQFHVNVYGRSIGDTVSLEVQRGERTFTASIVVAERQADPDRLALMVDPKRNMVHDLGILGLTLDERLAELMPPTRNTAGVIVASTAAHVIASDQGSLVPGDLIYAVNGNPVSNLADLRRNMETFNYGDAVVIHVERQGALMYLAFASE